MEGTRPGTTGIDPGEWGFWLSQGRFPRVCRGEKHRRAAGPRAVKSYERNQLNKFMSVMALAVAAGIGFAQDTGKEVVDKLLAHYQSVKGVSVDMSMEIKVDDPSLAAMMGSMDQSAHAVMLKPNIFAFWPEPKAEDAVGGMPTPWVYSDGKVMTSAVPEMEMYERRESPASFAAMAASTNPEADSPGGAWQLITGADVLVELMGYEPKKADAGENGEEAAEAGLLMEMLQKAEYKGVEGEGADAHYVLRLHDETLTGGMDFDVHVAKEGKPWLTALKPIMDENQGLGGMSMVMRFKNWKPAEQLPAAEKFAVADDWARVDDLMDSIMGQMMQGMEDEAQPAAAAGPGEGDPAINFTLDSLKGDAFTLADHAGKVVVVDFWATWCPPCVAGLPVVSSVTKEYASKGVVFVAVDLQEDRETVEKFMDKQKWDFPVAFDSKAETANAYGVTGIPHSVIIDKKGVVRHVHIGFGGAEEYEANLRKELDALVGE